MIPAFTKHRAAASSNTWRYWRIYVTANNGDTYMGVGDTSGQYGVVLAASAGGATVLTSSMTYTDETTVYGGTDTLKGTCTTLGATWLSNGQAGPWASHIDLGTAMTLVELRMYPENVATTGPARAPNTFQVQGSSDGTTWNTVASFSGVNNWSPGVAQAFAL